MKYWVITDTHLGHGKMEEYCGRPKDFEDRILRNLTCVQESDVLIHLGDV
jgi:calcineurin-like phosphoesterase family protein